MLLVVFYKVVISYVYSYFS